MQASDGSGDLGEHVEKADGPHEVAGQAAQITGTCRAVSPEQFLASGNGIVELCDDLHSGHLHRLGYDFLVGLASQAREVFPAPVGFAGWLDLLFRHDDFREKGCSWRRDRAIQPGPERHKQQSDASVPGSGPVTKPHPIVIELPPELTYPTGADTVLLCQVQGPLADHHVGDDSPVAVGSRPQPARKVEPEMHLVGDRRAGSG